MKNLVAALMLSLSFNAFAEEYTLPGSAGQPASQHGASTLYGCANDGVRLSANTAAGYGRCKAVYPLVAPQALSLGYVEVGTTSPDKTSSLIVSVYRTSAGQTELVCDLTDFSANADKFIAVKAWCGEPYLPSDAMFAVVEVRGDTKIEAITFKTND